MADLATKADVSAVRRIVGGVWTDVLKRKDVRSSDGFFDLGGTSLSAMRFIVAIEKVYGVDAITPQQLYGGPTFDEVVAAVEASVAR